MTLNAVVSAATFGATEGAGFLINRAVDAGRLTQEAATGLNVLMESMSQVYSVPLDYAGGIPLSVHGNAVHWTVHYEIVG